MAGEMTHVNPDEWPTHKAVADALGGRLMPFDEYQGPYVEWKGRRLFLHHPEEVKDALGRHGVTHPNPSDFVAADDPTDYLMATDDRSHVSTPAYPNTRDVARFLVDAIKGMEPSHV